MFDFSKIGDIIKQIWDFLIPPIINIGIILIVIVFLTKNNRLLSGDNLYNNLIVIKNSRIQDILVAYKISDLIPIISIILLTFLLNLVNKLIYAIGALLPVNVIVHATILYINTYKFWAIWDFFPDNYDAEKLRQIIEASTSPDNLKDQETRQILINLSIKRSKIWNKIEYVKFLILLSLFLLVYNLFIPAIVFKILPTIIFMICSVVVLFYFFVQRIALIEQEANFRADTFYAQLLSEKNIPKANDPNRNKEMKYWHDLVGKSWWTLRFGYNGPYWINYLKKFYWK